MVARDRQADLAVRLEATRRRQEAERRRPQRIRRRQDDPAVVEPVFVRRRRRTPQREVPFEKIALERRRVVVGRW